LSGNNLEVKRLRRNGIPAICIRARQNAATASAVVFFRFMKTVLENDGSFFTAHRRPHPDCLCMLEENRLFF